MEQADLADDFVDALHEDATIRRHVGRRVLNIGEKERALPNIQVGYGSDCQQRLIVTCRALTSEEAHKVGAAVVQVVSAQRAKHFRWTTVQDRSGYDATNNSFRRVIQIEPTHPSKKAR